MPRRDLFQTEGAEPFLEIDNRLSAASEVRSDLLGRLAPGTTTSVPVVRVEEAAVLGRPDARVGRALFMLVSLISEKADEVVDV